MNKFKMILSYLSVIAVCLAANMGLPVKATPFHNTKPTVNKTNNLLYLYQGRILKSDSATASSDKIRIADHESHASHVSHQSSY